MEQELNIETNDRGYQNIHLKPKPLKGIKGIDSGNHVILKKGQYAEGLEVAGKYGVSYVCKVTYKGEECSFFLNEKEHKQWAEIGADCDVKVSLTAENRTNQKTGSQYIMNILSFERAE